MCATCGCGHEHDHSHDHAHDHHHDHAHPHAHPIVFDLEAALLAKNRTIAEKTRRHLGERGILALNLVSSPGAGKTTLLERTIGDLGDRFTIQVIEGDQATSHDADRIRAAGAAAIQINTGTGCHLDAQMIETALRTLEPNQRSVLFIENVGNLVCPALFDLGERAKVVVASVTEGDDKPLKYPHMFRASRLVLLNKIDLLPYVRFDIERFADNAKKVNPAIEVLPISAQTGERLEAWYAWLRTIDAAP